MLDGKRILAVVPARGGSRGVPLKNIHPLAGRPLIEYTADVIRDLRWVDKAIVSTDHEKIANAARKCSLDVPFIRPPDLSGDFVGDFQVLLHALTEVERQEGRDYHVVIMLQPTCPLRKAKHVIWATHRLMHAERDSVWTVSETPLKYHPLKQLEMGPRGELAYYSSAGPQIIARQQLPKLYHRNGAAYVFTRECLMLQQATMGKNAGAVLIDDPLVNIDTLEDFREAERLLASNPPVPLVPNLGKGLGI